MRHAPNPMVDQKVRFEGNPDGFAIVRSQDISDDFLKTLASERHAKTSVRAGEMSRVASVPVVVWEVWMRQGRDPINATAREIVQWLEKDNLQSFITTPGRV